jgi:RHS repeat-associated protein
MESSRYGTRGVTLYGNGEAVAVSYSSSTSSRSVYLGKDILGSVRTATTDGGAVEDRYEYDAFGQAYKGDLSGGMNLGYTGKPYDARTGLYNYGYRDYRPQAARFTTADPIRDGNNWYAYVNNDPVNYIDLWGLDACSSVDKLKTQPIRGEERLPDGLINELVRYRGWTDISRDEEARNEAAMDLKQKCFDEEYQDNWFVGYISTTWDYKGTSYHGEHYLVYQYDPETGQFAPPVPVREYWDIDGNGRIDFSR